LNRGSDTRFDEIRSHFFKFLAFWIVQILWVWTASLPLTILNSPSVSDVRRGGSNPAFGTSRDIAGIVLWALGWVIESTADIQKFRYKSSGVRKDRPMQTGLWAWSRHPPYFGEMMCWWGIWILCISPSTNGNLSSSAKAAQYGSIVSPVFTVLILMFGSGVPTAEKPQARKFFLMSYGVNAKDEHANSWRQYKEYLKKTSILIPLPPALYRRLPGIIKSTLLLDFTIYRFDEEKDGAAAKAEDGNRNQDET